jgi:hypothetical protein
MSDQTTPGVNPYAPGWVTRRWYHAYRESQKRSYTCAGPHLNSIVWSTLFIGLSAIWFLVMAIGSPAVGGFREFLLTKRWYMAIS